MATPTRQSAQSQSSRQLNDLDDAELIRTYLEERPPESERAFSALYRRWTPRLKAFLGRRYGFSEEAAEELVQDTWSRVHRHAHRYDPDRKFSTWLYAITSNLGKNELRNRDRNPQVTFTRLNQNRDPEGEDRRIQWESEEDWSSPETSTENRQLMREIKSVIESLGPTHRIPMRLYHLEGLSYQEIADQMGIALGTVKSRLNRARKQFKEEWTHRQEATDDEEDGPRVRITEEGELKLIRPQPEAGKKAEAA